MTSTIDGLRGVNNHPSTDKKTQDRTTDSSSGDAHKTLAGLTDTVELTGIATQATRAEKVITETDVVDMAKVQQIKNEISNGTYKVDPERIAAQLMKFESDLVVES